MNDLSKDAIRALWPTWWLIRRLAYWFVASVPKVTGRQELLAAISRGEAGTSSEDASGLAEELGEWWRGYGSPDLPTDERGAAR